jgi:uncharacterized surface protein with fasciclin (FAS1) repeats
VFAPTDEAFAKIPKAQLDALLRTRSPQERAAYHVLSGKVPAADALKTVGKGEDDGSSEIRFPSWAANRWSMVRTS